MQELFFTKSSDWAYEEEMRILKSIEHADTKINKGELALYNLPYEAILSIYIGANASLELEQQIIDHIRTHNLDVQIYKMVLNPNTFDLDPTPYWKHKEIIDTASQNHLSSVMKYLKEYITEHW